jgi:hypothetical protein
VLGRGVSRTGSELGLVRDVILVELLRLLLGLLVVDGVGTGCLREMSAWFDPFEVLFVTPHSVNGDALTSLS